MSSGHSSPIGICSGAPVTRGLHKPSGRDWDFIILLLGGRERKRVGEIKEPRRKD